LADAALAGHARALEGLLSLGLGPVTVEEMAATLEVDAGTVRAALQLLGDRLEAEDRAVRLVEVAGGYVLRTAEDLTWLVARHLGTGDSPGLSAAAMEALAVVAYLQPVSRGQVSEIRGVSSDGVMRLLAERGLIRGDRRRGTPGEPVRFVTTELFLERFGLASLAELPPLSQFVPSAAMVEQMEAELRNR
jgi:segregation and condensation protein B